MSTINLQRVLDESQSSADMPANYAFKLSAEQKDDFLAVCEERGLAPGKVMRALLGQFLESTRVLG